MKRTLSTASLDASIGRIPDLLKGMPREGPELRALAVIRLRARNRKTRGASRCFAGTVRLSARGAEEGDFLRAESQAVAAVLEISLQTAKARSREARRKSAGTDFGIRDVEEVRELIVNRRKPLCLSS